MQSFIKRVRPKTYSVAIYLVALFIVLELIWSVGGVFWFRSQVEIELNPSEAATLARVPNDKKALTSTQSTNPAGRLNLDQITPSEKKTSSSTSSADANREANRVASASNSNHTQAAPPQEIKAPQPASVPTPPASSSKQPSDALSETHPPTDSVASTTVTPSPPPTPSVVKPGKTLSIGKVDQEPVTNSTGQTEFVLKIPLQGASGAEILPNLIRIQFFFYEQLPNGTVIPCDPKKSDSKVEVAFGSRAPNWVSGVEYLNARYFLPQFQSPTRSYHGYILRIFYKNELQDQIVEPPSLQQLSGSR